MACSKYMEYGCHGSVKSVLLHVVYQSGRKATNGINWRASAGSNHRILRIWNSVSHGAWRSERSRSDHSVPNCINFARKLKYILFLSRLLPNSYNQYEDLLFILIIKWSVCLWLKNKWPNYCKKLVWKSIRYLIINCDFKMFNGLTMKF